MLGKLNVRVLRRALVPQYFMPKRNWAQVGMIIAIPPRVRCSFGEVLLHAAFMITFWLTPMAYFFTQIKVWRRNYIGT